MAIDVSTVTRIAHLARLSVPDEQKQQVASQLDNILAWVAQLDEVDVNGIEPLANVNDMPLRRREDAVTDGGDPEVVLANTAARTADFYVVPKVVE